MSTTPSFRTALVAVTAAIACLIGPMSPAVADDTAPQIAPEVARDGTNQSRAAVSCWDIKQTNPKAKDGRYWLLTPHLKVPTQFYCDMTTDGGGWVLVGRGRDGWTTSYNGRGRPNDVSETVSGPAAFSPRQLDANIINSLFAGRRMDSVSPEIRVARSANTAGTAKQNVVIRVAKAERWTWALEGGVPAATFSIDGTVRQKDTTTRDMRGDLGQLRMWTHLAKANEYVRGFNYGQNVAGTTASDSYLYSKTGEFATPFAQIYVRPKLRDADVKFAAVGDNGTGARTVAAVPKNGVKAQTWGVRGSGQGGTGENGTEVQAFAQAGQLMIVGGNFTEVVKGADATGASAVDQPYLAAFDAITANYVSSFKPPRLNGQVKALATLPNNRVAVGGEFTTVGGKPRAGFVVLDAKTGAVDPAWTLQIENRLRGGEVSIRALDVAGDYLYLGGAMTHFKSPAGANYAKGAGRIKISARRSSGGWNPEFDGTVTALDVSADGSRVYYAGYFMNAQDRSAPKMAAFTTAATPQRLGADTWNPTFSSQGARYQQAIRAVGDKVWVGGAQHSLFSYDTSSFALQDTNLTRIGGDLQALGGKGNYLFGGCHCENLNYESVSNFDTQLTGRYNTAMAATGIDAIDFVGAWDMRTGRYAPDFSASMKARGGMGVWAITVANDGTLWAGGSLTSAVNESGRSQWTGGFARFGPRDTNPPGKPSAVTARVDGRGNATVRWKGASGADTYEVFRNDRVVASTTETDAVIGGSKVGDRFFVRAADNAGNRSASTARTDATRSATTAVKLVATDSSWRYLFSKTVAPPGSWKTSAAGTERWKSGPAPLGWGDRKQITTDIDAAAPEQRGLTSYFSRTFNVKYPARVDKLRLKTRADDGVAIYVNGVEVNRTRLPSGELTSSTYATEAISTANAVAKPVVIEVPTSVLRTGENRISVEVHSNYRATPSQSMAVELIADAR